MKDKLSASHMHLRLMWLSRMLGISIWIVYWIAFALQSDPILGPLLFVAFAMFPHAVSHTLCYLESFKHAPLAIMTAMIVHTGWIGFLYLDAFYLHPDPQATLVFVFAGVFALPVLIPIWAVALLLGRRFKG